MLGARARTNGTCRHDDGMSSESSATTRHTDGRRPSRRSENTPQSPLVPFCVPVVWGLSAATCVTRSDSAALACLPRYCMTHRRPGPSMLAVPGCLLDEVSQGHSAALLLKNIVIMRRGSDERRAEHERSQIHQIFRGFMTSILSRLQCEHK